MDANIAGYARAAALLGAAIAMGVGSLGPALGQGMIGQKACEGVAKYPESYSKVRMMMLIAMGMVETAAIYAFIIALVLVFAQ